MPLPRVYGSGGGQPIVSFDLFDIIGGVALEKFECGNTKQDTTTTYILSTNTFYSQDIEHTTDITFPLASFTKLTDLDYDIEVGIPRVMRGQAQVNVNTKISGGAAGQGAYIIFRIRKWDGSSETEIANGQTSTISAAGGGETVLQSIKITVPRTNFAIGDTIRLTLEVWGINTGASIEVLTFGNDPQNRTGAGLGASEPTTLDFHCPFEVQT